MWLVSLRGGRRALFLREGVQQTAFEKRHLMARLSEILISLASEVRVMMKAQWPAWLTCYMA